MSFVSALRNGVSAAWLKLVKSLNVIAASLFGGIILLNAAYPQAVTDLGGDLPGWAKIVGGIAWFSLVHYALTKAKNNAS
jgi:hypothetical protein